MVKKRDKKFKNKKVKNYQTPLDENNAKVNMKDNEQKYDVLIDGSATNLENIENETAYENQAGVASDYKSQNEINAKGSKENRQKRVAVKSANDIESSVVIIQPHTKRRAKKESKKEEIKRFNPSISAGLNSSQVEERKVKGLVNTVKDKNKKSYMKIILTNVLTFFNLLCFLVAGALVAVGAYSNVFFLFIVVANILIGIIQEIKAKKTIEKIKLVVNPLVKVVRDGLEQEIKSDEVVLDDILKFSTGKQICADCLILDGELEVNESMLTGESVPVKKRKGDTIYAGSFVVGGKCVARAEKVGGKTYVSKLSQKATQFKKPQSELLKSMRLVIRVIGLAIIPLAILTYYNIVKDGATIAYTIKRTAGVIIGVIPAGMFLLTSLALATGVIKLAKKRTLVQDLYSIEMLARTDVLCLDKTGTITDGTMKVNTVIQINNLLSTPIGDIVGSMLTALDDNNATSRALANHFGYSKEFTAKTVLPFTSSRKLSAVTFKNGETYAFGAPEFIYKVKNKEIDSQVKTYASKGFRVLMLAKCDGEIINDKLPASKTPIALMVIEDHIREDAEETIRWFKENGVEIKIISGDNPITVSEVSKRVGVENAERYISLEGLNDEQVMQAVDNYTIFGRVSPEQKCIIVKALKNKGHKVAMTGDGVNDILALKEADCSIAMASGSEAARHVSNLVLLDSNFSCMPSVVAEGRRVVNNVQNSSSLFLMKTIFVALVALIMPLLGSDYPFITNHLILLETLVVGIPSFFLALQPNADRINGNFLRNLMAKSLPAGLLFTVGFMACYLVYKFNFVTSIEEYVTMASLTVTFTGLIVLLRLCKPFNVYRGALFMGSLILLILALNFIPFSFFEYVNLSIQNILFIVVFVETAYPVYSAFIKWFDLSQIKRND